MYLTQPTSSSRHAGPKNQARDSDAVGACREKRDSENPEVSSSDRLPGDNIPVTDTDFPDFVIKGIQFGRYFYAELAKHALLRLHGCPYALATHTHSIVFTY